MSIILAADDHYAQHLGVTICSVLENNRQASVDIYVIDGGLSDANKERLRRLTETYSTSLKFLTVDQKTYERFSLGQHLTPAAYYRLSIPDIVPAELERILYLDCDMVVISDLQELWNTDLGSCWVGAITDFGMIELFGGFLFECPLMKDEAQMRSQFAQAAQGYNRKMAAYNTLDIPTVGMDPARLDEVARFASSAQVEVKLADSRGALTLEKRDGKLRIYRMDGSFPKRPGFPKDAGYFNSGMLLIDLKKWRTEGIGRKTVEYIARNYQNAKFFDQDALNVTLQGRWLSLPEQFNVQCNIGVAEKPDAVVIHYVSVFKPWYWFSHFPYSRHYATYLAKTPWAGAKHPFDARELEYIKFMIKRALPRPINNLVRAAAQRMRKP